LSITDAPGVHRVSHLQTGGVAMRNVTPGRGGSVRRTPSPFRKDKQGLKEQEVARDADHRQGQNIYLSGRAKSNAVAVARRVKTPAATDSVYHSKQR
jgi:hypothetical protein